MVSDVTEVIIYSEIPTVAIFDDRESTKTGTLPCLLHNGRTWQSPTHGTGSWQGTMPTLLGRREQRTAQQLCNQLVLMHSSGPKPPE